MSRDEVADYLGITPGSVRTTLRRYGIRERRGYLRSEIESLQRKGRGYRSDLRKKTSMNELPRHATEPIKFACDVLYAFADDEVEDGTEKTCPRCGKGLVSITVISRRYWAEAEAEAPYMTTVHTADRCVGANAQKEK